ncbi:MAG: hypothetical protein ABIQ95_01145 [Bdellovibrionia bacterium]
MPKNKEMNSSNEKPGSQSSKKHLRTKFLIYPRFQLLLIGVNSLITLGIFGIVFLQSYFTFDHFKQIGDQIRLPSDNAYFQLLQLQASKIYFSLAVATSIGILISGASMLLLSHRLAGPIVRLKSYFSAIKAGGAVRKLKFRRGDFFAKLPDEINRGLETLTRK